MDLDALRKAALSSKKRKRTPNPSAPTTAAADDEREEGEIDDDTPPHRLAPLPHAEPPSHHPYSLAYPPAPPLSARNLRFDPAASSLHAVKEESKRIIAQLVSFGVPPDYLFSIGISRDILETSFHELGLDFSLPHAYPDNTAPYSAYASTSLSAQAHPFTPRDIGSPAPNEDLAALEALKRQELLARKAALKARNAQSAQSLESELEGLFSASPSAATTPAPASPPAKGKKNRKRGNKKRKVSTADPASPAPASATSISPAQKVHNLRDAIDETEELVDVPSPGPFAGASASIAAASTRSTASFAGNGSGARTRPLATDFEAEPASTLPPPSAARGMYASGGGSLGGFLRGAPGEGRMVIELSDSDDSGAEDCDEPTHAQLEGARAEADPAPNGGTGGRASKAPSPGADAGEAERRKRLEEKEHEIQRMMARIAEMERRKKDAKGKKPEVEPIGEVAQKAEVGAVLKEEVRVESAQENTAMEDERGAVEASPPAEQVVPEVEADPPPPPAPKSSVTPVFRPYASSLARFPLIRASAPDLDVSGSTDNTGNAGLASWVARKRGVDSSKRLCKAEASGGRCHDDKCRSVHVASFVPTAEELAEYQSLRLAPNA